jgi:hypothetical protein
LRDVNHSRLDALRAVAESEALRALGQQRVRADPERLAAGWERRFVTDANRAVEAVALYGALGYEAVADPVRPEDLDDDCEACALATRFRTIYTRRRGAEVGT